MLQIYICDDEPSVLKYLSGFISRIAQKNNLEICLSCYEDARRLIFDLEDHINGADIIYLDVLMNSCNGIEAGKQIRALGCEAQLLYLTNSKHHAIASFDTSPLHYILKDDIASEKFEHIFLAAVKKAQKKTQDIFYYEFQQELVCVPVPDIIYLEICGRIVTLHTSAGPHRFYSSMKSLSERLSPFGFIRTHKSFLVNPRYIERVSSHKIMLRGQGEIPVGNKYAKEIRRSILHYFNHMFGNPPSLESQSMP